MKKTHTDQSILQFFNSLSLLEEKTSTSSKVAASKTFSVVSMLLVQIFLVNVLYSMG